MLRKQGYYDYFMIENLSGHYHFAARISIDCQNMDIRCGHLQIFIGNKNVDITIVQWLIHSALGGKSQRIIIIMHNQLIKYPKHKKRRGRNVDFVFAWTSAPAITSRCTYVLRGESGGWWGLVVKVMTTSSTEYDIQKPMLACFLENVPSRLTGIDWGINKLICHQWQRCRRPSLMLCPQMMSYGHNSACRQRRRRRRQRCANVYERD